MKRSPLLVIFVTVFIDLVGFGIVIPVLPFYVEGTQFDASPRAVGLLFASYSVMQLIFSPILGRLSDRYGRRPVLFFSLLGTSLGFFILGFATTLWMLFVGRIIDGITGGNISTAQAYIADVTTQKNRAKGMGLIGAAFGLGFIFGPAIGGILSRWGVHVPFLFAGALSLANATLLYFVLPETVGAGPPGARVGRHGSLVATGEGAPAPVARLRARRLLPVRDGLLGDDLDVRAVYALPLRLRRARHGLDIRLRRRRRCAGAGGIDRETGEDLRRAGAGHRGRATLYGEPRAHPSDRHRHGDTGAALLWARSSLWGTGWRRLRSPRSRRRARGRASRAACSE